MIQQRTQEWFQQRMGDVTGTGAGKTLMAKTTAGYNNYRAEKVLEQMLGVVAEDVYITSEMQHGIDFENLAALEYMIETGNFVTECEYVKHPTIAHAGVSPDREIIAQNGGVEIKCPNTATHIATLIAKRMPTKYKPQVQWQMACKGWAFVDFVSHDPRMPIGSRTIIIRVERDDAYIAKLELAVIQFNIDVEEVIEYITKEYINGNAK